MKRREFFALAVVAEVFRKQKLPTPAFGRRWERNASAIHGRSGAQVALLQSPILLIATKLYALRCQLTSSGLTKHIPVYAAPLWLLQSDGHGLRGKVCYKQ